MKIAVLSGKGGTGKTLLSVNLAACAGACTYMDCDVEEPNGHLYFKPKDVSLSQVYEKTPIINEEKCTACRKCADFCAFNALAFIGKKPFIFPEVCHGCGGCSMVCPEGAVGEGSRVIGEVHSGKSGETRVLSGVLSVGEVSGMPILNKLKSLASPSQLTVLDCPPGCGCASMDCVRYADFCLLVAEPTSFGAYNLEMVYELVKMFNKPFAVVLNKCGEGSNPSRELCTRLGLPVMGEIPFDKKLGLIHSEAKIAANEDSQYRLLFSQLLAKISEVANG